MRVPVTKPSSAPTTSGRCRRLEPAAGEPGRVHGHERDHEQQEQQVREDRDEPRQDISQQYGDVCEVDLLQGGLDLVLTHPEGAQPGSQVVGQLLEWAW